MAEEQSSLRQAMDSIMGWPGGQSQGGAAGGTTSGGVAPRTIDVVNLGTTSALTNSVSELAPDPFQAQLDAIKAQNDALSASLAAPAAATTAAPASAVASVPAAARPSGTTYYNPVSKSTLSGYVSPSYSSMGGTTYFGQLPAGAYKAAALDVERDAKTDAMRAQNDAKLAAYKAGRV